MCGLMCVEGGVCGVTDEVKSRVFSKRIDKIDYTERGSQLVIKGSVLLHTLSLTIRMLKESDFSTTFSHVLRKQKSTTPLRRDSGVFKVVF